MRITEKSRRATISDKRYNHALSPDYLNEPLFRHHQNVSKRKTIFPMNQMPSISDLSIVEKPQPNLAMPPSNLYERTAEILEKEFNNVEPLQKTPKNSEVFEKISKFSPNKVIQLARNSIMPIHLDAKSLSPRSTLFQASESGLFNSPRGRISPNLLLQPLFSVPNFISKTDGLSVGLDSNDENNGLCIIKPNLQNIKGQYLLGICNSYGPVGPRITEFIQEHYTQISELILPHDFKVEQICKSINAIYEKLNKSLQQSALDLTFSGSTLLTLVISGNNLICANTGNCKAIIAKFSDQWSFITLNSCHDFKNEDEKKRIFEHCPNFEAEKHENCEKFYFFIGNQRILAPESTRAFGDNIGKYAGIIHVPEIENFVLGEEDKFIFMANSDVWKVVSELEILEIAKKGWEKGRIDMVKERIFDEVEKRMRQKALEKAEISLVIAFIREE